MLLSNNMQLKREKINRNLIYFLIGICLFIFFICYYISVFLDDINIIDLKILTIINILFSGTIFIYCIKKQSLNQHIGLFCFNLAFFVLILGQYFIGLFDDTVWGCFIFSNASIISLENEAKGLFIIMLSLFCVFFGYLLRKKNIEIKSSPNNKISISNDVYGSNSLIIMYIGAVAAFIKLLAQAYYVIKNGYLSIYLNTGTAFYYNGFLDLIDGFYMIGFIGFLTSFPKKEKLKLPLILFIIYSVLSLFTGIRGTIVINILFLIWYFSKHSELYQSTFITKKKIVIFAIIGILFTSFLYTLGYSRVDVDVSSQTLFKKICMFLRNQGGSGHLISLSIDKIHLLEEYISKKSMILWPIENFLRNNSLFRIFIGGSLGQGSGRIGSFGNALTYITNYEAYIGGAAVGTCYIAELFCSCGFLGVIIFNILLGCFIKRMDYLKTKNWQLNVFSFKVFLVILYLPRQAALQFIPESFITIVFILIMSFIGKRKIKILE